MKLPRFDCHHHLHCISRFFTYRPIVQLPALAELARKHWAAITAKREKVSPLVMLRQTLMQDL